jgi:hypothetical protein
MISLIIIKLLAFFLQSPKRSVKFPDGSLGVAEVITIKVGLSCYCVVCM